jgi:iron(III) transport system substrate-binding protein
MSCRLFLPWLLAALALISGGCGSAGQREVVVYVAVDRQAAEPILRRFETNTGIRVRALYDAEAAKTTGLVGRLLAEAEHPQCDVFWNNELVQTLLLAERGLCQPYRPATAATVPEQYRDPQGRWCGVALRARVIAYNTRHIRPQEVPVRLADLADSRWRGKFAMANPQFGTTRTHMAALFAVLGEQEAQRLLTSWIDNRVQVVDGNAMVKNLVARADGTAASVLLGLTDTDDVLAGQAEGEPVAYVYPDAEGPGTLVIPATVMLIAGAPHRSEGQQLVDYLTSPEVERELVSGAGHYMPIRGSGRHLPPDSHGRTLKAMKVTHQDLLQALEPSSRWTRGRFP